MKRLRDFNKENSFSNRWAILASLLIIFLLFYFARLFDLQIIQSSYYKSLAEGNRIRRIPIKAPRGEILDKNKIPLARNIPLYKLANFSSSGVVESTEVISREKALEIQTSDSPFESQLLIDTNREYPYGEITAHLLGYVNETVQSEIRQTPTCNTKMQDYPEPYQLGDLVGRLGIEQEYDCLLRGVNGEELIEVDAKGRLVRRLGRKDPIPGKTLQTSIDFNLQKVAYEALLSSPLENGKPRNGGEVVRGGVIVQKTSTGEVLVLVSSPSFDPKLFGKKYQVFANDKNLPFFNRAIGGAFHPGSIFKLVTTIAGVEEGVLGEDYKYTDIGYVEAGGLKFKNWLYTRNGGVEGEIGVVRAIQRSTDTFFYILGEKIGIEKLSEWAFKLGFGNLTKIDLPHEAQGLIPTPDWKLKTKKERWFLGNTYNTSIGQGDVTTTPLQVNRLTGLIANGGKLCTPHVKEIENETECRNLGLRDETLDLVRQGMIGACSPGGTAGIFFNFKPQIACKTGTAETGTGSTHAWFTAYGPANNPEIVVTAFVEEAGEGSTVAAPVVKKILEKYFDWQ